MLKFVKKSFLFLFPVLLLMIFVNYCGDAGGLFSSQAVEAKIAKYLVDGYNVANVLNIDERSLHRNIIHLSENTPSTIVLGSSTIMLIKAGNIKSSSFMNHGVSGASIEDLIAIYQLYKIKGNVPRKVIIGIDTWIFNENSGQVRWRTLKAEFASFLSSEKQGMLSGLVFNKAIQLISPSYFQSSMKILIKRSATADKFAIYPTKLSINDGATRLTDGSISYDIQYRNVTKHDVDNKARQFISGDIYSLEKYTSFSKKNVHLFNTFVDELLSNNIEVEFILMPYHPIVYDFLTSNNKYRLVVELEQYINDFASKKRIPVTGSFDPSQFNLNSTHFYDGMHLNEMGVAMVLGKTK